MRIMVLQVKLRKSINKFMEEIISLGLLNNLGKGTWINENIDKIRLGLSG